MKAKILIILFLIISLQFFAQTPQSINYQGVARNASGNVLTNQNIGLQLSVLNSSSSGTPVYAETFNLTTDANGLFSLQIGSGTPILNTFAAIDWSTGNSKWLQVSMDPSGGTNYQLIGSSQFVSVPYALYAEKTPLKAGNGITISNDSIINTKPNIISTTLLGGTVNYFPKWTSASTLSSTSLLFDNGTNVGIGSTNPQSLLHLAGSLNSTQFIVQANSTQSNTNPLIKLQNSGGQDLMWINSDNSSNVFIGLNTGNTNAGVQNLFVGWNAGQVNTNGISNTFLGANTGYSNYIGSSNSFVGFQAGYLSIGSNNSFMGSFAGVASTGNNNTAFGYNALATNTAGSNNTAIGNQADVSNNNLSNATAIGNGAFVTASNNMMFGNTSVVGWGFGATPTATQALIVGTGSTNGNGANLTLTGTWTSTSDSTKKYAIKNTTYGLKDVMKLRSVEYKFKGTTRNDIGFLAQEVKLIIPEVVYGKEGHMTLSYGNLTAVLAKAIQEQQKIIESLQKDNQTIKAENQIIKTELSTYDARLKALERNIPEVKTKKQIFASK